MKKLQLLFAGMFSLAVMISCGGSDSAPTDESTASATTSTDATVDDYDPTRGLGKWDETNVDVSSFDQIGRASCRERVWNSGSAEAIKKKDRRNINRVCKSWKMREDT